MITAAERACRPTLIRRILSFGDERRRGPTNEDGTVRVVDRLQQRGETSTGVSSASRRARSGG
jgi:hypothetical protein